MSQTPSPYQIIPPPLPPVDIPMAALAGSTTTGWSGRPGVVTAIGVISIIVASLGILASAYAALMLLFFQMAAAFAPMGGPTIAAPPPATMPTPAAIPSTKSVVVSPRGLEADDRAVVAAALAELRFLSAARLEQLDALLAAAGKDMLPNSGQPLTAAQIERLVKKHASGLSADPNLPGPDTFRTESGRFELYDDRAVFYPLRGEIVRVSTLTSTTGLSPAQVELIVQQAQTSSGNTLNASQAAALRTLLTAPGQQYVSPITVPTAIRSAQAMGDGSVFITFPNGYASLGPQGQIQMSGTTSGGAAAAGGGFPFGGRARINKTATALTTFALLAGMGLAIYLLIIGILVLRRSPRGRKLHLIYAYLKIPVEILFGVAMWWMLSSFMDSAIAQSGSASTAGEPMLVAFWMATASSVVGLIYPLALLIALHARSVKAYYNTM